MNPSSSIYVPEVEHHEKRNVEETKRKGNTVLERVDSVKDNKPKITMIKQKPSIAAPSYGTTQYLSPSGLKSIGKVASLRKAPQSSRIHLSSMPSNSSITRNKLSGLKNI